LVTEREWKGGPTANHFGRPGYPFRARRPH
jgi:hypothetical protein